MGAGAALSWLAAAVAAFTAFAAYGMGRAPGWRHFRLGALAGLSAAGYLALDPASSFGGFAGWAPVAFRVQLLLAATHVGAVVETHRLQLGPHRSDALARWLYRAAWGGALLGLWPGLSAHDETVTRPVVALGSLEQARAGPLAGPVGLLLALALALHAARLVEAARGWRALWGYAASALAMVAVVVVEGAARLGLVDLPPTAALGYLFSVVAASGSMAVRFFEEMRAKEHATRELAAFVRSRTDELSRARDALHRAEKLSALGQLAAGVAHEINNPAAAVVANLGYVLDGLGRSGELPPDGREALEDSLESMRKITGIAAQLLAAGRPGAPDTHALDDLRLAAVVRSAVGTVRTVRGATVKLRDEVSPDVIVRGRAGPLGQVLVNLLTNAVQAIEPGRTDGLVRVRTERALDRVRLVIEDNGPGIPEEQMSRVFEPFFTTKKVGEGTGLGLPVSLGIVRSLGGDLRVERAEPHGTRMVVELDVGHGEPRVRMSGPDFSLLSNRPAQKRRRLLVVEDERSVREALKRTLAAWFEVDSAEGPEEALRLLRERSDVDAVLCDAVMDEGGGERVYRTLLEERPELAKRLVFLTGGSVEDPRRSFLAEQPQPVLNKPLELRALQRALDQLPS